MTDKTEKHVSKFPKTAIIIDYAYNVSVCNSHSIFPNIYQSYIIKYYALYPQVSTTQTPERIINCVYLFFNN